MNIPIDRPRSVTFNHPSGATAKIHFIWGMAHDPVPKGIRVEVKSKEGDIQVSHEKAIYRSFDQAVQQGTRLANVIIETSEPLPDV
ncbi:hypothetical protein CCL15_02085 [Pseudomonas syringae]|uniref:hypothetical protein n=1 Tax=Pseudomonas syringae group TaxID=136849 RepID=UPI000BB62C0B|nr:MULTISPECIES: hypothetical protein [Pseudomonas syringae group]PBP76162.1 hypothetical protein CCL15_02085 [Pseudomonas syringae]